MTARKKFYFEKIILTNNVCNKLLFINTNIHGIIFISYILISSFIFYFLLLFLIFHSIFFVVGFNKRSR